MDAIIRNEQNEILSVKGYKLGDTIHYTEGAGNSEKMLKGVMKRIEETKSLVKIYINEATLEDVVFSWQIVSQEDINGKLKEKKEKAKAKTEAKEKAKVALAKAREVKKQEKEKAMRLEYINGDLPARVTLKYISYLFPEGYTVTRPAKDYYEICNGGEKYLITYKGGLKKLAIAIRAKGYKAILEKHEGIAIFY